MTDCPFPEKKSFTSEAAAKRALRRGIKKPQGRMYAYRCGGHWHLGHGRRWWEPTRTGRRRER